MERIKGIDGGQERDAMGGAEKKIVVLCYRLEEANNDFPNSNHQKRVITDLIKAVANDAGVLEVLLKSQRPSVLSS